MEKLSLGAAERPGWGKQQALHTRERKQDWSGLEAQRGTSVGNAENECWLRHG